MSDPRRWDFFKTSLDVFSPLGMTLRPLPSARCNHMNPIFVWSAYKVHCQVIYSCPCRSRPFDHPYRHTLCLIQWTLSKKPLVKEFVEVEIQLFDFQSYSEFTEIDAKRYLLVVINNFYLTWKTDLGKRIEVRKISEYTLLHISKRDFCCSVEGPFVQKVFMCLPKKDETYNASFSELQ